MPSRTLRPRPRRRALRALLLGGLILVASPPRTASPTEVPDPRFCIVDHVAIASWNALGALSGNAPCSPTATPGFDAYIKDTNAVPIAGLDVALQLGGPAAQMNVYTNQQSGVTVNCLDHSLHAITDAQGAVHFVPRFGRYVESANVPVLVLGVVIRTVEARSPDYDGNGTVGLSDLTTFAGDYFDVNGVHPRSDFDDCPGVTLADFAFFAGQYVASAGQPAEPICP